MWFQKTCEDCGAVFSARGPLLAALQWAEHYRESHLGDEDEDGL